jgi:hypothetical protein
MKATWLFLLILLGCRNESPLLEQNGRLFIKGAEVKIDNLNETNWQVGRPRRRSTVTQNFVFTITLPYLEESAKKTLYEKYGLDGWVLKITHRYGSQEVILGHVYAPMAGMKHRRLQDIEINQTKSVAIKISYAASYISERFRAFDCPAFGHNRKLNDINVQGTYSPMDIEVRYPSGFYIKPEIAELTPSNFNAGNSLTGDYTFELALYSLKNRAIATAFIPIKQSIKVGLEERVDVNGCAGIRPELQEPK